MALTIDQPIESLPPIPSDEMQEIMNILATITESDAEELQILKQLTMTGCGDCGVCECSTAANMGAGYDHRDNSQCISCRYFEAGASPIGLENACLIAWDGEDTDETCEQVEISLFMLADKGECPYYTIKPIDNGRDRKSQCVDCISFDLHTGCGVAWGGNDEQHVAEEVETTLFLLANKGECPHFAANGEK